MRESTRPTLVVALLALLCPALVLAGFSSSDLFLPMAGRQAGVHPSNWYTTVWIHNPGQEVATARIYFLERGTSNPAPPWVDVAVGPGETSKIENIVESLFHVEAFGALRVTCATQKLSVTSRVYSRGEGAEEKDSVGQDFAGVPASFAIGLSEKTEILGAHQTIPTDESDFRYNFGFVETTGDSVTVRVTARDGAGQYLAEVDLQVRGYSQRQVAFKDWFPDVSTANTRLEVEVISGSGKVIGYGSGIANGSQDPTTFEMQYADALLGATAVSHDETLVGDGTPAAPLGVADGAISAEKLAPDAVTSWKIVDGTVRNQDIAYNEIKAERIRGGDTIGYVLTTTWGAFPQLPNEATWQPAPGDISSVTAGDGLRGGGTSGDLTLAVTVPLSLQSSHPTFATIYGDNTSSGKGVVGSSIEGEGLRGYSALGIGAVGTHGASMNVGQLGGAYYGAYGKHDDSGNYGALGGESRGASGVHGETLNFGDLGSPLYGVYGKHYASHNYGFLGSADFGVQGMNEATPTLYGYLASNENGVGGRNGGNWGRIGTPSYAGHFNGPVLVTGWLSKSGGGFQIDHPLDPENKVLNHSFVESPEMKNVYDGLVVTDEDGLALVELPEWFETLNRDFRYQLTVIGRFAQAIVEQEIDGNRFAIRTNLANVRVSWQVTGTRNDPWAQANRPAVEQDKPERERGTYLNPEAYGRPVERSVEWVRSPDMMRTPQTRRVQSPAASRQPDGQ